jgi:3D (Asp-Asp-Asp) domain-containing protein
MKDLVKKGTFSGLAVLVVGLSFIQQQVGKVTFLTDSGMLHKDSVDSETLNKETINYLQNGIVKGGLESTDQIQGMKDGNSLEVSQGSIGFLSSEEFEQDDKKNQDDKDKKDKGVTEEDKMIKDKTDKDKTDESVLSFTATAYCLKGKTASGVMVRQGIIAADPKILPIGSLVKLKAGSYSGTYVVADTGGRVRGRKIDLWLPKCSEAIRFGRRNVKLTVLQTKR